MDRRHPRADPFASLRRDLRASLALIAAVAVVGTAGFMIIEGWGFLDSLFMTTITLSSVGYGETHPLHAAGRVFTIALIVAGVAALGNVINQLARGVSEGYFRQGLAARRRSKMISQMTEHFIVCGYGRIGQHICRDLLAGGASLVVVERDAALVERAEGDGLVALRGDATSDPVLLAAGIERTACVLCALPSDAENLYIVLSAKFLNAKVRTIVRSASEEGTAKLLRVGADKVVSPYLTGAKRMAALALRPQVVDLMEAAAAGEQSTFVEEIVLGSAAECPYVGRTLRDADIRQRTGVLVLALRRRAGAFIGSPPPDTLLTAGDMLICLGSTAQLRELAALLMPDPAP